MLMTSDAAVRKAGSKAMLRPELCMLGSEPSKQLSCGFRPCNRLCFWCRRRLAEAGLRRRGELDTGTSWLMLSG